MRAVRLILIAVFTVAILVLPTLASADGVTWTLNNVSLSDGGTVSGSFNYDASTNTYSAINVISTAGSVFSGASYSSVTDAVFAGSTVVGLGQNPFFDGDLTGQSILALIFLNPLTNAGGSDSVFVMETDCTTSTCLPAIPRLGVTGSVTGAAAAPEPPSILLLTSGILGLTLFFRRR
jgi:hypothetical protein